MPHKKNKTASSLKIVSQLQSMNINCNIEGTVLHSQIELRVKVFQLLILSFHIKVHCIFWAVTIFV